MVAARNSMGLAASTDITAKYRRAAQTKQYKVEFEKVRDARMEEKDSERISFSPVYFTEVNEDNQLIVPNTGGKRR